MKRIIHILLVCAFLLPAETPAPSATGKYHFTTAQTPQSLNEAATLIRSVASITQVSVDESGATLGFSGSAEATDFAAWILPRIDKTAIDANIVQEFRMAKDVGRLNFLRNLSKPQEVQELLTVLRTVADVQRIYSFTPNHAIAMRGDDWTVSFAEWIIEQIDQPLQEKPEASTREYTVGGPDFRGMGHGARINFLSSLTSPQRTQELLTVLRTVGDVQKVFSFSSRHTLILRAGDTDLNRAEWIIQQLDQPGKQPAGNRTFAAPTGDDMTRMFPLGNATPQWIQGAITSLRSEHRIKKIFPITAPANLVVRGTADQIAATATWMAEHNALTE
jgi:hypothetical protein